MGEPTPFSSFPGARFYPSDEQLISYYLSSKNGSDHPIDLGFDLIKEIDLYNFDPFNLPDSACFRYGRGGRRRHWFCFMARVSKGRWRRAVGGYWKKRGRVRDVMSGGAAKVVMGTRKSFVFHLGDSTKTAVKTGWLMHEYAPVGHHMASFVLCRVFVKSTGGNNLSGHVLSSYGGVNVATVRHVGIQCDGTAASVTDSKVHDENTTDQENDVTRLPSELVSNLNCQPLTEHVSHQIGLESNGPPVLDGLSAQELTAILEEDFIELDDLLGPPPVLDGLSAQELTAILEDDFIELDDLLGPLPGIS